MKQLLENFTGAANRLFSSSQDGDYCTLHQSAQKLGASKRKDFLITKEYGKKLNELLFFLAHQKKRSAMVATPEFKYVYELMNWLDESMFIPLLRPFWGANGVLNRAVYLLEEHIQDHKRELGDKWMPIYLPAASSTQQQRKTADFITALIRYSDRVRFIIFTDEEVRPFITMEFDELQEKRKKLKKWYLNAWRLLVESPIGINEGKKILQQIKQEHEAVPFANFWDKDYLQSGRTMPGDIQFINAPEADIHVTITGILSRMGLHRQNLNALGQDKVTDDAEIQQQVEVNYLYYILYYSHRKYIVAQPEIPRQIYLSEKAYMKLSSTSPDPIRVFIIARLVTKYHLPVQVLFRMIDVLEEAHAIYHKEGAKTQFRNSLITARLNAREGRKRGDFSLVLGRTYLFKTEKTYLHTREKLLQEGRFQEEVELSEIYQRQALEKYMSQLDRLLANDHAAYDFFLNAKLYKEFAKFYPDYPTLYTEWLVDEFSELSSQLNKSVEIVSDKKLFDQGLLPEHIVKELKIKPQDIAKARRAKNAVDVDVSPSPSRHSPAKKRYSGQHSSDAVIARKTEAAETSELKMPQETIDGDPGTDFINQKTPKRPTVLKDFEID